MQQQTGDSDGDGRTGDATEYVGRAVPRTDAASKVTGEAVYAMDLRPGSLLHAKLVTSRVPHAELLAVDTAAAESLDGVVTVLTGEDVPDRRRGAYILDQPILAREKVRFVGEPVAVVVAESEAVAETAVGRVEVEYDRLEPVFDLEAAFGKNPPAVVHENVREYEFLGSGDPRYENRSHLSDEDADRPNVLYRNSDHVGDVERGFAEADRVVDGEYEVKPIQHCTMEPHVMIGREDADGITIRTSQQVPHKIKDELCSTYPDLEPADLTVKTHSVGGGFGGKVTPFLEAILVAAVRRVSRPVRLQLTRSEEYTVAVSRPQVKTRIRDGVTADGRLVARNVEITYNGGAYNEQVFKCTNSGPSMIVGCYDIPNVRWDSYAVYTNLPRFGSFRGFGKPEVNWAIERHMDRVADELGIDPLAYRKRNLLTEGDTNAKGETLGPNDTERCLTAPVEYIGDIDVEQSYPEYAGSDEWTVASGFAYGSKPVSRAVAGATVKLRRDMNVEVRVGAPDIGQGADTVLSQIAAEEFGIDVDRVSLVTGDTDRTMFDMGPTGSRFTYHTGNALRKAAREAKRKALELATAHFDGSTRPEDLSIEGGRITDGAEGSIHVNELFSEYSQVDGVADGLLKTGGELIGTATYDSRRGGEDHAFWTPVGGAALVAVNGTTGRVEVLSCCTACDVGRAINPKTVEQQLEGGAAQAVSIALFEEIEYDNGRVVNPTFKDYRIPSATELPYDSETIVLESFDENGPFGAKGVGEMGMIAAAPAVGNAVSNAVGAEFETLPVTPERVLPALTE